MRISWAGRAMGAIAMAAGLVAALVLSSTPVAAAGAVTHCANDSQFSSRLAGGGTVTFNCGRTTILLSSLKTITKDTVINGGGKITFTGANAIELFHVSAVATLTLKNIVLEDGSSSGNGGAIDNDGTLHLDHVRVTRSKAPNGKSGGAIYTTGTVTAKHSTFDHNTAGSAGAIMAFDGTHVTVSDSTFQNNWALDTSGSGGAIVTGDHVTLQIKRSVLTFNFANGYGGAVQGDSTSTGITIADSYFYRNQAIHGGGAVYSAGTLTLNNATFDTNAGGDGGAVWSLGFLTATNVTLWSNAADWGGAFEVSGTADLYNVTMAGNTAGPVNGHGRGGNIFQPSGALTMYSTLVADAFQSDNCTFLGAATGNFSLSTDGTCNFGSGQDNVTVTLGNLETNGGPVPTMRLPKGSAAIDAGDTLGQCAATDARGVTRPKGARCDVGAFEYRPCTGKPAAPSVPATDTGTPSQTARDVFLDWVGPDCATTYRVVVRSGSKTGPKAFSTHNPKDSSVTTGLLAPGSTYYWRVSACNAKGCLAGPWWHFKLRA